MLTQYRTHSLKSPLQILRQYPGNTAGVRIATGTNSFYSRDIGAETTNGNGVEIARVIVTGRGALYERGLDKKTLLVITGEFGRTPKIKPDGGRDHYAKGWPVVMSGAGVRGGQVIGATDIDGVDVTERPISVADLCRTFCHVMGMDANEEYHTTDNRPMKVVDGGKVIEELFT
mgnify:CR=1 FL=1